MNGGSSVTETIYDSRSELAEPRRFLGRAFSDLLRSVPIGWELFRAGLRSRHRRTFLGYLWLLVPAAVTTLICAYLHSRRVFTVGPTELPYAVHVLAGMVLWQVFVDALNAPLRQLQSGRPMITRTRVPHEAVLVSGLYDVGLGALVRLAALVAVLVAVGLVPAGSILLVPVAMAALAILGFFLGLLLAPAGLLYDDFRHGLPLVTGLWFFLTPIIYPAPAAGPLQLNPVTPLLDAGRSWILSPGVDPAFLIVTGFAAIGLVPAWLFYRLARPHLVARLG